MVSSGFEFRNEHFDGCRRGELQLTLDELEELNEVGSSNDICSRSRDMGVRAVSQDIWIT